MPLEPWPSRDPDHFCHDVYFAWHRCRFLVWPAAAGEAGFLQIDWYPEMLIDMSAEELERYREGRRLAEAYAAAHGIIIDTLHISQG